MLCGDKGDEKQPIDPENLVSYVIMLRDFLLLSG